MSTRRLPPLNALRAFDVATRHMSFKHAADELCITSAAVSHRIRALEEWLGVKLFNRLTRSLELTKEGEAYAPMIRQAFTLLMDASDTLKQSNEGGDLLISTTM
jgi:LysR family glycine cleavage system transcriptional activator